jgi:hypothetical protein
MRRPPLVLEPSTLPLRHSGSGSALAGRRAAFKAKVPIVKERTRRRSTALPGSRLSSAASFVRSQGLGFRAAAAASGGPAGPGAEAGAGERAQAAPEHPPPPRPLPPVQSGHVSSIPPY